MGEAKFTKGVAWGVFVLRLVLGGILLAHGVLRLWPSNVEKEAAQLIFPTGALGTQGSLVLVGAGEIFVGLLVLLGFFLRLALIPLAVYLILNVIHFAKSQGVVTPSGSSAEEYLILLVIALALIGLGPGKLSLDRAFKGEG